MTNQKTMRNKFAILITSIIFTAEIAAQTINLADKPLSMTDITIIYDNYKFIEGNAKVADVDFSDVDEIIISHNHGDHTGGINTVLTQKKDIPVYIPYPPDKRLEDNTGANGGKVFSYANPFQLSEHVWTSGTMGDQIREQCLVIDHEKGLIVIVGCSHPGIAEMLASIKKNFNTDIYAVMGGFHLMNHTKSQIQGIIDDFNRMGVKKCGCTHCTGEKQIQQFREAYGDDFMEMGTGRRIEI